MKYLCFFPGNPTSYGKSEILLHPNKSPENGSCNITPQDGVTLKTTFTFNCSEWADSDNDNSPLLYWLKFQDSSGSWNVLYRGIRSIVGVYLPIGDASQQSKLRLQVLIEDVYGAQTVGLERYMTNYVLDSSFPLFNLFHFWLHLA